MARKPHSSSLILLLVCIFAFWWGVSVFTQGSSTTTTAFTDTTASASTPLAIAESQNGTTYTYSGTYTTPACEMLGSGIAVSDGGSKVTLLLTTSESQTGCAQTAGDTIAQQFSVSVTHVGSAPQFAGVLLNGSSIPANITAN